MMASSFGRRSTNDEGEASGHKDGEEMNSGYSDIMHLMNLVSLTLINSNFRCWNRWNEIYVRYSPAIMHNLLVMNSDSGKRGEALATLIDNFRAYLREIAESTSQETQRLWFEFDSIAEKVWPAAEEKNEGPYWRAWRVKQ